MMIHFFRKIRQILLSEGKTGKYLTYAIGEILLVVIGILIAVQINSYYKSQADIKTNNQLLSRMLEEINLNIERVDLMEYGNDTPTKLGYYHNSFAEKRQDSIISLFNLGLNEERIKYIHDKPIFNFSLHNLYTSVYEEMKNTGKLYTIGSDSLITKITKYYKLIEQEDTYHTKSVSEVMADWRECKYGWHSFENDYKLHPKKSIEKYPWLQNKDSRDYRDIHMYVMKASSVTKRNRKRLQNIKKASISLINSIEEEL